MKQFLAEVAALSPEGTMWADGLSIYAANCTICHGVNGEGSDLAVPLNTPEIRVTDTADLARIIDEGVPGTMMAGWNGVLNTAEVDSVVSFLQNWDAIEGEGLLLTPPKPIRIDLDNPQEVLASGRTYLQQYLYRLSWRKWQWRHRSRPQQSAGIKLIKVIEQIRNTIINGGHRPNSSMPAFRR